MVLYLTRGTERAILLISQVTNRSLTTGLNTGQLFHVVTGGQARVSDEEERTRNKCILPFASSPGVVTLIRTQPDKRDYGKAG